MEGNRIAGSRLSTIRSFSLPRAACRVELSEIRVRNSMLSATQFFQYWALAFVTLCIALLALHAFYQLVDSHLSLHHWGKELGIAVTASFFQGGGFWVSAWLFHGEAFRRPVLVIPFAIAGMIYWISHAQDWSGYEVGGIALFQAMFLSTGACVYTSEFKLAAMILGIFAIALAGIASIARKL